MRSLAIFIIAVCLVSSSAPAQEDWRETLQREYVQVEDGKLLYEGYDLITVSFPGFEPSRVQVKTSAEAPASLVSRDYFVGFITMATTMALLQMYSQAYQVTAAEFMEAFEAKSLDAPIGKPDLELNLTLTPEGFQFEVVDTASGSSNRSTQTWDEVYGSGLE